jgi:hypothetical protein
MRSVVAYGQPLVDDPARLEGVAQLGMDETAFLRANRRHHTLCVSGLVDTATGRLLDVVRDRTAKAVITWLGRQAPGWLERIGVVALDPHRGYANAVGVHLGHATLVVDHFHVIRLANAVVDDVRRRVQNTTTGHRGRAVDPLYGIRKLLLKACDDLDPRGWGRLVDGLAAGDPNHADLMVRLTVIWSVRSWRPADLGVCVSDMSLTHGCGCQPQGPIVRVRGRVGVAVARCWPRRTATCSRRSRFCSRSDRLSSRAVSRR